MPVLLEIVRIIDENFAQCFPLIKREQFLQDFEPILVRKNRVASVRGSGDIQSHYSKKTTQAGQSVNIEMNNQNMFMNNSGEE